MSAAIRGALKYWLAPGRSPPTARPVPARWEPPRRRRAHYTGSHARSRHNNNDFAARATSRRRLERQWRAAATSETAVMAAAVSPAMRAVVPRPLVGPAVHVGARNSPKAAGSAVAEGRHRAEMARVRALGGGTHLLGRPEEALPPPSRQWQGGRPPPDAKTALSAAPTAWKQPRERGQQAPGQPDDRYSRWAQAWRVGEARTFSGSTIGLLRSSRRAATLHARQTGSGGWLRTPWIITSIMKANSRQRRDATQRD